MGIARWTRLAGIVLAVMLVQVAPVSADDPDASKAPRTSGPLVGDPFDCEDNGPAGRGESKVQACSWIYKLAPVESNLDEDFYAFWSQIEVDPGPGPWCAKGIGFDLRTASDARILSAEADRSGRAPQTAVTTLTVNGAGAAPVPGVIEQDVLPGPGKVDVSMSKSRYRYRWTGNVGHKVMVAIGVQIASPRPLDFEPTESNGIGASLGPCRPFVVRVVEEHKTHR